MPCSVDSTPTSANQEDHVSMACHAALRLLEMNENLTWIIAIELLAATQGVEFRRPLLSSVPLEEAVRLVRTKVAPLKEDRILAPDMKAAFELVRFRRLIDAVGADGLPVLQPD